MVEPDRVLQPLQEEAAAIGRLDAYATPAELADAVVAVRDAVDRSLRLLLRADPGAPEDVRLKALSAKDLPRDELIAGLRRRERISLGLAGVLHELERATARAVAGNVQADDAAVARRVVDGLRLEVRGSATAADTASDRAATDAAASDVAVGEAAHRIVATDRPAGPHRVDAPGDVRSRKPLVLLAVALLGVAAVVILAVVRPAPSAVERGIEAFAASELAEAEAHFETALRDDSLDVDALLYLGRIYRRDGRFDDAARVLTRAQDAAPGDAGVRRELGYLFMDLGRPAFAARQFDRARELEPGNDRNWIALIRALRAAGDPESEVWLQRAPPEVRAAIGSDTTPAGRG
jgi:tetratricopeptide (TPR) repeat protein